MSEGTVEEADVQTLGRDQARSGPPKAALRLVDVLVIAFVVVVFGLVVAAVAYFATIPTADHLPAESSHSAGDVSVQS
jgi:hypothetical protein